MLAVVFNKIFDSKELPSNRSTALIVLTLKSGAPSLASNYRGISLLTSSYKLLTSTVARRKELLCGTNNVLSDCQFSFRTTDALFILSALIQNSIRLNSYRLAFVLLISIKHLTRFLTMV